MRTQIVLTSAFIAFSATAQDTAVADTTIDERVIVTGERMSSASVWVIDAKKPRQPLPAHDGGDFLKTLAGFTATRNGGASSDPLFRGMGASRLTIVNDNQMMQGGCSNRMDPPTAYITPQSYDSVTIIKGPQSVRFAGSAATILFEREPLRFGGETYEGYLNATTASFGRLNSSAELIAGNADGYLRTNISGATADNYEDGNGTEINSRYQRWSADFDLGWTPSQQHHLELSLGVGNSEAAYADRAMDGSQFERRSVALAYQYKNNGTLQTADVNGYFNHIDHVMDNYSLRDFQPSMMMPNRTARNPDRYSRGIRTETRWQFIDNQQTLVGAEYHQNEHRDRISRNQSQVPYQSLPRTADADTSQLGLFIEHEMPLSRQLSLNSGLRADHWRLTDNRQNIGSMMQMQANPTANMTHSDDLWSGFLRLEQRLAKGYWYVGWGQAERFPDYWETIGNNRQYQGSLSALFVSPETNQQLDIGFQWRDRSWRLESSVFYSDIDDFILLEQAPMQQPERVRNIKAKSWGGEATARYFITPAWQLSAALSVTRGSNRTDDSYLPQQPADELRFATEYRHNDITYAAVWRVVAQQDMVDVGRGNVIGYDFAETPGYGILSANVDWSLSADWQISSGIDNILDKTYTEHVSSAGANIAGFEQIARVNEPGRVLWLQTSYQF
ncbi:MAG: TonB-dependent copper receptor [Pseudomonadota bacterium]